MMESGIPITMNVEPAGSSNNGNNGWGGDGSWWIILFLIFAMFGWGGFGGYGNNGGGTNGAGFQGYATRSDITESFAMNNLDAGIRAVQQGICDATYALNNAIQSGFNTTNMNMMQGFNGVQSQICNLGAQLSQCCCDIRASIQDVNYNMAKNTCDITNAMNNATRDLLDNQNSNTRAILDFLVQSKMDEKDAQIAELQRAASQDRQSALLTTAIAQQTSELIRRLGMDYPVNAVVVQPNTPVTFPTNSCGTFNGGWGSNCNGCSC
ncbi:MAG: hypothetical protein NC243_11270 [Lachnoclostridium sp.]|nr:hypothetical protein [Lachnoclostridium sp.]MCM1385108.1 hypothetical protein [Lachnoclostridium sp.]